MVALRLRGFFFFLRTGLAFGLLPAGLIRCGCGSGSTVELATGTRLVSIWSIIFVVDTDVGVDTAAADYDYVDDDVAERD